MLERAFSALARVCQPLPHGLVDFLIGRVMIRWMMMGWPGTRRAALDNLRRIIAATGKEASAPELASLLERSLELYARFILVMMNMPKEVRYAEERVELALLEQVAALRAEGRGVILATPNFGMVGHGIWALGRDPLPFNLPILRREFLSHAPAEIYAQVHTVGRSGAAMVKALAANETVCAIVDINFLSHRRTTVFFGAPAPLGYAASRLALVSEAPLLPVYAVYGGERYRFEADAVIRPRAEGRRKELQELNDELARSMERYIGRYPEQWLVYEDFWNTKEMDWKYQLARKLTGG